MEYNAPSIEDLGSFAELTLGNIYKTAGTGDVIIINGEGTPVTGGSVLNVS